MKQGRPPANFAFLTIQAIGLLALHAGQLSAATYYVRTDGNNANAGTGPATNQALRTIDYALANRVTTPGDIVYVKAGTYVEEVKGQADGTSANPIQVIADTSGTITGWSSGSVKIQAPAGKVALDISNTDYIRIIGFKIQGNGSSAAVRCNNGTDGQLRRCEIFSGSPGIIVTVGTTSLKVINCLIRNNNGDGIHVTNGNVTVWNSTVTGNQNGLEMDAGSVTVTNSIFAFNSSEGLDVNGGAMTHTYNLVYGNSGNNWEGTAQSTGEISVDPLFAGGANFRLKEKSPALNAGTNAAGTVDNDLVGVSRPLGATWDLGCYEGSTLVLHWTLDESSGSVANDSSVFDNDGTHTDGATAGQAGVRNLAASFDGSNDYVGTANDPSLELQDYVTMAAWVYPDSTATSSMMIINKEGEYEVGLTDSGVLQWAFANTTPGWAWHTTGYVIRSDRWSHVVVTYDAGAVKTYVNGVLVETYSGAGSIGDAHATFDELRVGGRTNNPSGQYFKGRIDDVRVYSRAISAADVAELHGLVGHWTFDDGSGTTIVDSTLMANNAAFNTGTPSWTTGVRGGALAFDGTNDVVTGTSFEPPATGAVAFWMQRTTTVGLRERLFGVGGDWEVRQEQTGTLGFDLGASPFVGNEPFSTTGKLSHIGRWYHVVAQFNVDSNAYEVYVDGQLQASGTSPVDLVTQAPAVLTIGNRAGTTERYRGALDDLRIYNRWLLSEEIAELYGLVGRWKLNESSGSVANDTSGAKNHGSYQGSATPDASGPYPGVGISATEFPGGAGDDVDLPDMQYDFTDGFTVALWVKPNVAPGSGQFTAFFDFGNGTDTDEVWLGWVEAVGFQLHMTDNEDGSNLRTIEDNTPFDVGEWVHCVAVIGSDGFATLYRNGQATKSGFYTSLPTGVARTLNSLATSPLNDHFNGSLQDVRLYNREISEIEIAELYGLVGRWRMEETSGSTVADFSGAGNHGTISGTPAWSTETREGSGSLSLNGTNYVTINGIPTSSTSAALTGWVKLTSADTEGSEVVSLGDHFSIRLDDTTSSNGASARGYNGVDWDTAATGTDYENAGWHHFAGVFDDSTLEIRLYIDGLLRATEPASGPLALSGLSVNTILGAHGNTSQTTRDFSGLLDDVRVYNRALSDEEVRTLYYGDYTPGVRIIEWTEVR